MAHDTNINSFLKEEYDRLIKEAKEIAEIEYKSTMAIVGGAASSFIPVIGLWSMLVVGGAGVWARIELIGRRKEFKKDKKHFERMCSPEIKSKLNKELYDIEMYKKQKIKKGNPKRKT